MGYRWSARSAARLSTCHHVLVALFDQAIETSPADMTVLCGHRGEEEQNAAFNSGASKLQWPKSKHNRSPSLAVDVAPWVCGAVSWDWPDYYPLADHIKATWASLPPEVTAGWRLQWGGDWRSFRDGPHWELVPARGA
jgi:peptidoglycan L-alanyl-D-glutamate endopeptidase CwlK